MLRSLRSIQRFTPVAVMALVAACSPGDDTADLTDTTTVAIAPVTGPAPLDAVAGTLRLIRDTLHFAHCGASGSGTALDDRTNGDAATIVSELGPDNGVTALVDLEGRRLTEVHYAAPEGASCTDLPPAPAIEARGQEPFWFVAVSGDTATVKTPEELDGVHYTAGQWARPDSLHWRFEATHNGEALVLELAMERCADAMSGARYPLRATLTRNGTAMSGCALQGRGR